MHTYKTIYFKQVPTASIKGRKHDTVVSASLRLKSTYDGLAH